MAEKITLLCQGCSQPRSFPRSCTRSPDEMLHRGERRTMHHEALKCAKPKPKQLPLWSANLSDFSERNRASQDYIQLWHLETPTSYARAWKQFWEQNRVATILGGIAQGIAPEPAALAAAA